MGGFASALRVLGISTVGVTGVAFAGCSPDVSGSGNLASQGAEVIWGNANLKNFENVSTPAHQEYGTAVGLMTNKSELDSTSFSCPVPPTATDCTWILSTQPSGLCAGEFFSSERKTLAACTVFMIGPDRFATAAHCMTDTVAPWNGWDQECAQRSVVMRWRTMAKLMNI